MIDDSVASPEITEFLRGNIKENEGLLKQLELQAKKEYIPIIQPEVAQLIRVIIKTAGIKSLLEIGTAIGYSAIVFKEAMGAEGKVDTIEIKYETACAAEKNIKAAGMDDSVNVICADAAEALESIADVYSCVFLDAAKGQYINFLPKIKKRLKRGGILISDNILYRGAVAEKGFIPRKHRTIIRNLQEYLYVLCCGGEFETTVLPIGDGVAVSVLK